MSRLPSSNNLASDASELGSTLGQKPRTLVDVDDSSFHIIRVSQLSNSFSCEGDDDCSGMALVLIN